MVAIMTKFEMPEYYNQSKPKPDKEEVLIERKCNICGKSEKMGKFERFCSFTCKHKATSLDHTSHGIRFR
tara:strand:- start:72 stop:281 length:210 start_codon:yes stop_codon:yes gene_type:complete